MTHKASVGGWIFALAICVLACVLCRPRQGLAQTTTPSTAAPAKPPLQPEELEQVLAPIALYPDSLLSQVLMASTYPLEIVEADRWVKENSTLKGDALAAELEKQTWDPSVKSLVNFPPVLSMMSTKLDWTLKLGDAFIASQDQIMKAVQALRTKAKAQGTLKTTAQEKVTVETPPDTQVQVIKIEPADPQVIYVPTYNPTVVYGAWPYPAYPPYYYYPPNYQAATAVMSFGVGLAIGVAWGYAWGGCDWGHHNVNVNINQNININNHINRTNYTQFNSHSQFGGQNAWQHDPSHRQGIAYRDQTTAQRFGASSAQASQARDSFRGRSDLGEQSFSKDQQLGAQNRSGGFDRGGAGDRDAGRSNAGTRSNAFEGADRGGAGARTDGARGRASRGGGGHARGRRR